MANLRSKAPEFLLLSLSRSELNRQHRPIKNVQIQSCLSFWTFITVIPLGAATTDISQTADLGLIGAILPRGRLFRQHHSEKYLSRFIPSILSVLLISLALVVIIGRSPMGWSYQQLHVMHTLSLALILFYAGTETRISDIESLPATESR